MPSTIGPNPIVRMADGDTLIDEGRESLDGTRATLFAIKNSDYPGDVD
jgi:hypothetical protein